MKTIAIIFSVLVATAFASPLEKFAPKSEKLISDQIIQAIEAASQSIKDAGLDPFQLDSLEGSYALPVPIILTVSGIVENLELTGLSNIVVNEMNYSLLANRLTWDISLPEISFSLGNAAVDMVFFGSDYESTFSGSLVISEIRIAGDVRINIGIITGISIRSLTIDLSLGGIESNLAVNLFGNDISNGLNNLLGNTIPNTLNEFQSEINELLELVILSIINDFLN